MLWYHTDRNEITREEFRRMLLDTSDSLPVTSPETPCPSPTAGLSSRPPPPPSRGQRSCSNDYTAPVGDVSEWSARQQQTLNCTAYEQNVRRAMGSDATYGNCELGRGAGERCRVVARGSMALLCAFKMKWVSTGSHDEGDSTMLMLPLQPTAQNAPLLGLITSIIFFFSVLGA